MASQRRVCASKARKGGGVAQPRSTASIVARNAVSAAAPSRLPASSRVTSPCRATHSETAISVVSPARMWPATARSIAATSGRTGSRSPIRCDGTKDCAPPNSTVYRWRCSRPQRRYAAANAYKSSRAAFEAGTAARSWNRPATAWSRTSRISPPFPSNNVYTAAVEVPAAVASARTVTDPWGRVANISVAHATSRSLTAASFVLGRPMRSSLSVL